MATVRDLRRCPKFDALFENIEVTEVVRRPTDQDDIIVIYFESMSSDMLGGQITVTPEVAATLDLPFPVPSLTWDLLSKYLSEVEKELLPHEQVSILESDNRDENTTWLWINDHQYVEIKPWDFLLDAIQNSPPETAEKYEPLLTNLKKQFDKDLTEAHTRGL